MNSHHHEVHIALTELEADTLVLSGMPPYGNTEICSNCGTDIARRTAKFIPFAFVLNEYTGHNLCLSCSAPITRPRS